MSSPGKVGFGAGSLASHPIHQTRSEEPTAVQSVAQSAFSSINQNEPILGNRTIVTDNEVGNNSTQTNITFGNVGGNTTISLFPRTGPPSPSSTTESEFDVKQLNRLGHALLDYLLCFQNKLSQLRIPIYTAFKRQYKGWLLEDENKQKFAQIVSKLIVSSFEDFKEAINQADFKDEGNEDKRSGVDPVLGHLFPGSSKIIYHQIPCLFFPVRDLLTGYLALIFPALQKSLQEDLDKSCKLANTLKDYQNSEIKSSFEFLQRIRLFLSETLTQLLSLVIVSKLVVNNLEENSPQETIIDGRKGQCVRLTAQNCATYLWKLFKVSNTSDKLESELTQQLQLFLNSTLSFDLFFETNCLTVYFIIPLQVNQFAEDLRLIESELIRIAREKIKSFVELSLRESFSQSEEYYAYQYIYLFPILTQEIFAEQSAKQIQEVASAFLHLACSKRWRSLIRLILQCSSRDLLGAPDTTGKTPIDYTKSDPGLQQALINIQNIGALPRKEKERFEVLNQSLFKACEEEKPILLRELLYYLAKPNLTLYSKKDGTTLFDACQQFEEGRKILERFELEPDSILHDGDSSQQGVSQSWFTRIVNFFNRKQNYIYKGEEIIRILNDKFVNNKLTRDEFLDILFKSFVNQWHEDLDLLERDNIDELVKIFAHFGWMQSDQDFVDKIYKINNQCLLKIVLECFSKSDNLRLISLQLLQKTCTDEKEDFMQVLVDYCDMGQPENRPIMEICVKNLKTNIISLILKKQPQLLENKFLININSKDYLTVLEYACYKKDLEFSNLILTYVSKEERIKGHLAYFYWFFEQQSDQRNILLELEKYENWLKNNWPEDNGSFEQTLLHLAAERRYLEVIKFIDNLIGHTGSLKKQDMRGNTPLHYLCCIKEAVAFMSKVIEQDNSYTKIQNRWGNRLIHVACGAPVSNEDTSEMPLIIETIEVLIDNDISEPKEWQNEEGKTPLHLLASRKDTNICKAPSFVHFKRFLSIKDQTGKTPIHIACECDHIGLLVEFADKFPPEVKLALTVRDGQGYLPLHLAILGSAKQCINFLVGNPEQEITVRVRNCSKCKLELLNLADLLEKSKLGITERNMIQDALTDKGVFKALTIIRKTLDSAKLSDTQLHNIKRRHRGRKTDLAEIENRLKKGSLFVLSGENLSGKTYFVQYYLSKFANEFQYVFYIDLEMSIKTTETQRQRIESVLCDQGEKFVSDLKKIFPDIGELTKEKESDNILEYWIYVIKEAITRHKLKCLIIINNVDFDSQQDIIKDFTPIFTQTYNIFTTILDATKQNEQKIQSLYPESYVHAISKLDKEEAVEILHQEILAKRRNIESEKFKDMCRAALSSEEVHQGLLVDIFSQNWEIKGEKLVSEGTSNNLIERRRLALRSLVGKKATLVPYSSLSYLLFFLSIIDMKSIPFKMLQKLYSVLQTRHPQTAVTFYTVLKALYEKRVLWACDFTESQLFSRGMEDKEWLRRFEKACCNIRFEEQQAIQQEIKEIDTNKQDQLSLWRKAIQKLNLGQTRFSHQCIQVSFQVFQELIEDEFASFKSKNHFSEEFDRFQPHLENFLKILTSTTAIYKLVESNSQSDEISHPIIKSLESYNFEMSGEQEKVDFMQVLGIFSFYLAHRRRVDSAHLWQKRFMYLTKVIQDDHWISQWLKKAMLKIVLGISEAFGSIPNRWPFNTIIKSVLEHNHDCIRFAHEAAALAYMEGHFDNCADNLVIAHKFIEDGQKKIESAKSISKSHQHEYLFLKAKQYFCIGEYKLVLNFPSLANYQEAEKLLEGIEDENDSSALEALIEKKQFLYMQIYEAKMYHSLYVLEDLEKAKEYYDQIPYKVTVESTLTKGLENAQNKSCDYNEHLLRQEMYLAKCKAKEGLFKEAFNKLQKIAELIPTLANTCRYLFIRCQLDLAAYSLHFDLEKSEHFLYKSFHSLVLMYFCCDRYEIQQKPGEVCLKVENEINEQPQQLFKKILDYSCLSERFSIDASHESAKPEMKSVSFALEEEKQEIEQLKQTVERIFDESYLIHPFFIEYALLRIELIMVRKDSSTIKEKLDQVKRGIQKLNLKDSFLDIKTQWLEALHEQSIEKAKGLTQNPESTSFFPHTHLLDFIGLCLSQHVLPSDDCLKSFTNKQSVLPNSSFWQFYQELIAVHIDHFKGKNDSITFEERKIHRGYVKCVQEHLLRSQVLRVRGQTKEALKQADEAQSLIDQHKITSLEAKFATALIYFENFQFKLALNRFREVAQSTGEINYICLSRIFGWACDLFLHETLSANWRQTFDDNYQQLTLPLDQAYALRIKAILLSFVEDDTCIEEIEKAKNLRKDTYRIEADQHPEIGVDLVFLADMQVKQGDYQEAQKSLDLALTSLSPTTFPLMYTLACELRTNLKTLNTVSKQLEPSLIVPLQFRFVAFKSYVRTLDFLRTGLAHLNEMQYKEAEQNFSQALEIANRLSLGRLQIKCQIYQDLCSLFLGNYGQLEKWEIRFVEYEKCVRNPHDLADIWLIGAFLYLVKGELKKATEQVRKVYPGQFNTRFNTLNDRGLGILQFLGIYFDNSLFSSIEPNLAFSTTLSEHFHTWSNCYIRTLPESTSPDNSFLKDGSFACAHVYFMQGEMSLLKGEYDLAITCFEKVVDQQLSTPLGVIVIKARVSLSIAYLQQAHFLEAKNQAELIIQEFQNQPIRQAIIHRDYSLALVCRDLSCLYLGDFQSLESLKDYDNYIKLDSSIDRTFVYRAWILLLAAQGLYESALDKFKELEIIHQDFDFQQTYNSQLKYLLEQAEEEPYSSDNTTIMEKKSGSELMDQLCAYLNQRKKRESITPTNKVGFFCALGHLTNGLICCDSHDYKTAKKHFRQINNTHPASLYGKALVWKGHALHLQLKGNDAMSSLREAEVVFEQNKFLNNHPLRSRAREYLELIENQDVEYA